MLYGHDQVSNSLFWSMAFEWSSNHISTFNDICIRHFFWWGSLCIPCQLPVDLDSRFKMPSNDISINLFGAVKITSQHFSTRYSGHFIFAEKYFLLYCIYTTRLSTSKFSITIKILHKGELVAKLTLFRITKFQM